jgi:hypothetical protein
MVLHTLTRSESAGSVYSATLTLGQKSSSKQLTPCSNVSAHKVTLPLAAVAEAQHQGAGNHARLNSGSLQCMSILLLHKLLAPNKRAQLLPLAAVDHLRLLDQAPNQERGFEGAELLTTRFL